MKQILHKAMIIYVTLVVLTLVVACESPSPEITKEEPRSVRYQQVIAADGVQTRLFSGVSKAGLESKLSFKVAGTVKRIAVKVGDKVKRGQLIAELDDKDYELKAKEAQAKLVSARAQERNAGADYKRVRGLYESRNASRNDLDSARAAFESSKASVSSAENQLEISQRQLSYTSMVSPQNCNIAELYARESENVNSGAQVILVSCGHSEVKVNVPEAFIADIQQGDEVKVRFDAIADRGFTAQVTEVGVASTELATTFPVIVRLSETNSEIRSGLIAEVVFQVNSSNAKGMIVPAFSVGEDTQGRFVYTLELSESGFAIVHRSNVKLGALSQSGFEVLEGLTEGDLVVTAGVSRIRDGQRVKHDPSLESRM